METVYQAVDRQLGEIVKLAGPEVRCLVFSGHGLGPMSHASWNLQEMLDGLGFGNTAAKAHGRRGHSRARESVAAPPDDAAGAIPICSEGHDYRGGSGTS